VQVPCSDAMPAHQVQQYDSKQMLGRYSGVFTDSESTASVAQSRAIIGLQTLSIVLAIGCATLIVNKKLRRVPHKNCGTYLHLSPNPGTLPHKQSAEPVLHAIYHNSQITSFGTFDIRLLSLAKEEKKKGNRIHLLTTVRHSLISQGCRRKETKKTADISRVQSICRPKQNGRQDSFYNPR